MISPEVDVKVSKVSRGKPLLVKIGKDEKTNHKA